MNRRDLNHTNVLVLGALVSFLSGCGQQATNESESAERWRANDDPSEFASDLEYRLSELPNQGSATPSPWAGSYWPTYNDNINYKWDGATSDSPAKKYELAFGVSGVEDAISQYHGIDSQSSRTACTNSSECDSAMGETCAKRDGEDDGYCIPTWWGICHGWAPGAILQDEPEHEVTHNGVTFKINDLKAMASLMYTKTNVKFLSYRCYDNEGSEDNPVEYDEYGRPSAQCRDTNPGTFHVIMANYLGIRGESFVEDRTFDDEVWNQPMRSFTVNSLDEITFQRANELVGVTATGGNADSHSGDVDQNEWFHAPEYTVTEGSNFRVAMTGTNDADLYVRFGEQSTTDDYDCRPYVGGSDETCDMTVPTGVTKVYVSVRGYASQSDFTANVTYGGSTPDAYVFNDDAVRFFHADTTARYITESSPGTDGNLSNVIDNYTRSDRYTYVLELDADDKIIGGEWIGNSKRDHPDFLWLPLSQNGSSMAGGKITYSNVKTLLDMSVDNNNNEEETFTASDTVVKDEWKHFGPFDATQLKAVITGTGDADLYVRNGAQPTTSEYDCRPYVGGSSEECTAGAGQVYVSVRGYASSSTFNLTVTYSTDGGGGNTNEEVNVNESGTVAQGAWSHYGPFTTVDGLTAAMTGTGDADLYVRKGAQPTTSEWDCRPYSSGSNENCSVSGEGDVYVSVRGYASSSNFNLAMTYFESN